MNEERGPESRGRLFTDLQIGMIEFMIYDYDETSTENAFKLMAENLGVDRDEIKTTMIRLAAVTESNQTDVVTRLVRRYVLNELGDISRIPSINMEEFNVKEKQLIDAFGLGWTNSEICENLRINQNDLYTLRSPVLKKLNTKSRFMVVAALEKSKAGNA